MVVETPQTPPPCRTLSVSLLRVFFVCILSPLLSAGVVHVDSQRAVKSLSRPTEPFSTGRDGTLKASSVDLGPAVGSPKGKALGVHQLIHASRDGQTAT